MSDNETKKEMTVSEAGRHGGTKVRDERGQEFYKDIYKDIGKKGGQSVKAQRGPEFYREIGRKGGQAVKEKLGREFYENIGRKGGEAAHAKDPSLAKRAGAKGGARVREAMALLRAQEGKKP